MIESRSFFDSVSPKVCNCSDARLIAYAVTNQDIALLEDAPSGPPQMKGFLNKYTNVAKGYNSRWFVLKDGVLSCRCSPHLEITG